MLTKPGSQKELFFSVPHLGSPTWAAWTSPSTLAARRDNQNFFFCLVYFVSTAFHFDLLSHFRGQGVLQTFSTLRALLTAVAVVCWSVSKPSRRWSHLSIDPHSAGAIFTFFFIPYSMHTALCIIRVARTVDKSRFCFWHTMVLLIKEKHFRQLLYKSWLV